MSNRLEQAGSFQPFAGELLGLAEAAIDHGLARGAPLEVTQGDHPQALLAWRASFVTLRMDRDLRGCIGSVEAHRPLAEDVAANAFSAAFRDPRFPALTPEERPGLELKIEILSPPEPLEFQTEEALLAQLEPGRDGLLLEAGNRRGTFLPTVWDTLPDREAFWRQLKRKAGLPEGFFDPSMQVYRYRTEIVP